MDLRIKEVELEHECFPGGELRVVKYFIEKRRWLLGWKSLRDKNGFPLSFNSEEEAKEFIRTN